MSTDNSPYSPEIARAVVDQVLHAKGVPETWVTGPERDAIAQQASDAAHGTTETHTFGTERNRAFSDAIGKGVQPHVDRWRDHLRTQSAIEGFAREAGRCVSGLDNGLTAEQGDALDDLRIELVRVRQRIEALGRHRSLSLAVTKIEEAEHWLRDRAHKPAQG